MYVAYQDFIQIGILIVSLANVFYQIYKGKRNSCHYCKVVNDQKDDRIQPFVLGEKMVGVNINLR